MENDINDYRTDCIKGHTCIKNLTQLVASATNAFKNIISSILRVVVHDHLGCHRNFFIAFLCGNILLIPNFGGACAGAPPASGTTSKISFI